MSSFFFKCFLREGSLQKLSRKGYQQRMFFLVNKRLHFANLIPFVLIFEIFFLFFSVQRRVVILRQEFRSRVTIQSAWRVPAEKHPSGRRKCTHQHTELVHNLQLESVVTRRRRVFRREIQMVTRLVRSDRESQRLR